MSELKKSIPNARTNLDQDPHKSSELLFVLFLAILVGASLIAMLSYSFVAARPPLVIAIPLAMLILFHGYKLFSKTPEFDLLQEFKKLVFNSGAGLQVVAIFGWMIAFIVIVMLFGNYSGMLLFMVILMKFVSGESTKLSLGVSLGTTGFIYFIFTFVLGIELYDGIFYMLYQGYEVF